MKELDQSLLSAISDESWQEFLSINAVLRREINEDLKIQAYPAMYYENNVIYPIPYRLFYNASCQLKYPKSMDANLFCVIEKVLLTRHHNGFIRAEVVAHLLKKNILENYAFVVPYLIRLLGEYVREIWQMIYQSKELFKVTSVEQFVLSNPKFMQKTLDRTITYTNEYYRHDYKHYKDAEGYQMIQYLLANFTQSTH